MIFSRNGFIDVMRYLVQDLLTNVNNMAHEKLVETGLNKRRRASSSFSSVSYDSKGQSQTSQEEDSSVISVISPLQTALQGFARFNSSRSHLLGTSFDLVNESRKAAQPQHEKIIMFLFDSGSKINDLSDQNVYSIQLTAKFCSDHIVEKFILLNTDVNATKNDKSAFLPAIERELFAASISRKLFATDATIPKKIEEQKKLLEQALRYFQEDALEKNLRHRDYFDGQFLIAPSLQYVFNEGSEAVLFDLLHQMSQIATTEIG